MVKNFKKGGSKKKGKFSRNQTFIGKNKDTIVFTLIVLIFALGVLTGQMMSNQSFKKAEIEYSKLELNMDSIIQRVAFINDFGSSFCDNDLVNDLNKDLFNMGQSLIELEKNNKIDTERYNLLKQKYNVEQVLYYSILKRYQTECHIKNNVILFFFDYSNKSKLQGSILNEVYKRYPNSVKIVAMDYNYTPSLKYFYDFYKPKVLPFIVINYNKSMEGLTDENSILQYIKE